MSKKQWCSLTPVTAMLMMTALVVWKLHQVPAEMVGGSGSSVALFANSIVMYVAYLYSTLSSRSKKR